MAIIKGIDVPFILIERAFSVPFYALLNSKTVILELGHSWIKWAICTFKGIYSDVNFFTLQSKSKLLESNLLLVNLGHHIKKKWVINSCVHVREFTVTCIFFFLVIYQALCRETRRVRPVARSLWAPETEARTPEGEGPALLCCPVPPQQPGAPAPADALHHLQVIQVVMQLEKNTFYFFFLFFFFL